MQIAKSYFFSISALVTITLSPITLRLRHIWKCFTLSILTRNSHSRVFSFLKISSPALVIRATLSFIITTTLHVKIFSLNFLRPIGCNSSQFKEWKLSTHRALLVSADILLAFLQRISHFLLKSDDMNITDQYVPDPDVSCNMLF